MPYGGTTPDQDKRIEACVIKLTPKHGKTSAIRICKAAIMKADSKR
jgi:hypothetical protein